VTKSLRYAEILGCWIVEPLQDVMA